MTLLAGTGDRGVEDGCAPQNATLSNPNGIAASRVDHVLYTNNFLGVMGSNGGSIVLRAIHVKD